MNNINLETNADWHEIDRPVVGDIVHLKCQRGFTYLLKVVVTDVVNDGIAGCVDEVFDWEAQTPITAGEIRSLVNLVLTFQRQSIHKLITKNL